MSIINRTHPFYMSYLPEWEFFLRSYLGGVDYINNELTRNEQESDARYTRRKSNAHRINHCANIVDTVATYLFKEEPTRRYKDDQLKQFFQGVDKAHEDITQFMKSVAIYNSCLGRVYIVMDKPEIPKEKRTGTKLDDVDAFPYMYIVYPQNVLDMSFDDFGKLRWILFREFYRDDTDPFNEQNDMTVRYRLWTQTEWYLYDSVGNSVGGGTNTLGEVPVIISDNEKAPTRYNGVSLIRDVAYMDKAIFQNFSRLDTMVEDQTFSQLIFPIEGLIISEILDDEKLRQQFLTLATNRILFYSAQSEAKPEYISPDASQAEIILKLIASQTKQVYANIGIKLDQVEGSTPASGVSKSHDFEKLNKLLASKAQLLEDTEKQIVDLYNKWMSTNVEVEVLYSSEFDVRSLADDILLGQELTMLSISPTFTKQIHKNIADKALPKADVQLRQQIHDEIDAKNLELDEDENVTDFDDAKKGEDDIKKKGDQIQQKKYRLDSLISDK